MTRLNSLRPYNLMVLLILVLKTNYIKQGLKYEIWRSFYAIYVLPEILFKKFLKYFYNVGKQRLSMFCYNYFRFFFLGIRKRLKFPVVPFQFLLLLSLARTNTITSLKDILQVSVTSDFFS